jgi:hypothetical protein
MSDVGADRTGLDLGILVWCLNIKRRIVMRIGVRLTWKGVC